MRSFKMFKRNKGFYGKKKEIIAKTWGCKNGNLML